MRPVRDRVLVISPGLYYASPWPLPRRAPRPWVPFVCWSGDLTQATRLTAAQAFRAKRKLRDYRYGQDAQVRRRSECVEL